MAAAGSSLSPITGRSAAGSRTAELHADHCAAILRYCRSRLPSQEDAEDATQIVFMNAYRGLSNGVEPRSEAAWLFKIAYGVAMVELAFSETEISSLFGKAGLRLHRSIPAGRFQPRCLDEPVEVVTQVCLKV